MAVTCFYAFLSSPADLEHRPEGEGSVKAIKLVTAMLRLFHIK